MSRLIVLLLFLIITSFSSAKGIRESGTEEKDKGEIADISFFMHSRNLKEDSFVWKTIEQMNNVNLSVVQASTKELENKLTLLLASGDIPDIINWYSDSMENKMVSAGLLLPLNKYWDEYEDIKKSRSSETWDTMTSSDGNIYSIGWNMERQGSNGLAYRQDWLDNLDLEIPTTLDEYFQVALMFSRNDPDGNGVDDTYAMGGYQDITGKTVGAGAWWDHIWGAFGALPNHWMEERGTITNGSVSPAMKDAIKYLRKMYFQGLIDPEFVTDNSKRWKTKVKSGVYGAGVAKLQLFDKNNQNNYYIPFKQKNPQGYFMPGPILKGGSRKPLGVRAISKKGWLRTGIWKDSPNVEAALRLLNWTVSKENNRFLNYGIEEEHHTVNADGKVKKLVDTAEEKLLGLTQFYMAYDNLIDHTSLEYREAGEFFNKTASPDALDGIYVKELTTVYERLKDQTNQAFITMIVGEDIDVDREFEKFVNDWNRSGGKDLTVAVNAAYKKKRSLK